MSNSAEVSIAPPGLRTIWARLTTGSRPRRSTHLPADCPVGALDRSPARSAGKRMAETPSSPVGTIETAAFSRPCGTCLTRSDRVPSDKSLCYDQMSLRDKGLAQLDRIKRCVEGRGLAPGATLSRPSRALRGSRHLCPPDSGAGGGWGRDSKPGGATRRTLVRGSHLAPAVCRVLIQRGCGKGFPPAWVRERILAPARTVATHTYGGPSSAGCICPASWL